jgi:hypothetical protein
MFAVGLPSTDSDTYWQLATGRWMLAHRALLHEDIFSSTVAGTKFGIGEWLGQLALAGAYEIAGWAGLAVLRALCLAVGAFFLAQLARRGTPPWIALPLLVAALLVSKITWSDRPLLFTLALFPLLLAFLYPLAADPAASRRLYLLPPLFLLWANLHGGYLLGLIVLGVFAAQGLIAHGRRGVTLAIAAAASAAATFLNPVPLALVGSAREDVLHPPRFLVEFLPPDVLTPPGALFALFAIAVILSAMLRGGTLIEAMLLVPLLYLGMTAQRHMQFFCFAALPSLGPRLPSLVPPALRPPPLPAAVRVPTALVLLGAALGSVLLAPRAPDDRGYPSGALALLRQNSGILLNEYDWGGYLIFRVPERPVFIDGRYVPYLGGVLDDYRTILSLRPGWRDLVARYRVDEALLAPDRPLAAALREGGWQVRGEDPSGRWVLLAKP